MQLDELTDEQLDQQLREILAPAPRSRSRERQQRDRLIRFITTGEPGTSLSSAPQQPGVGGQLVELDPTQSAQPDPRRRRWWILAAAAAAVALIGGLVIAQRPADAPAPAQQPTTAPSAPPGTGADSVPSLPARALEPDRFGVVTDAWPSAAGASAMWGGQLGWDNPAAAEALVARRDGQSIHDGIALSVRADDVREQFWGTPQQATVAGMPVELYVEPGTPAITTVVLPGTPTITASGLDPIAFLEAAGGFPVHGQRVDDDGEVTFAVGALPEGYEVIVPPERFPLGSVEALTRASDGDGGDGISVWVTVRNPLIAYAQVGDLQPIDINGVGGWLHDRGRGSNVMLQVSDITWANVGGASSVDDAVDFARSIDFVDETSWTDRYDVERGSYPTRDETMGMATPPVSTLPEPTTLVVSRAEAASVPTDHPIACGDNPPTDEVLADSPSASSPDGALAEFLATERARTLLDLGYREVTITETDTHRYERYNNVAELVTVIEVSPAADGWRATRVEASPC